MHSRRKTEDEAENKSPILLLFYHVALGPRAARLRREGGNINGEPAWRASFGSSSGARRGWAARSAHSATAAEADALTRPASPCAQVRPNHDGARSVWRRRLLC